MKATESRPAEFASLCEAINESLTSDGVSIIGLSGHGGIGKSYLLDAVLQDAQLADEGVCHIQVDGSDQELLGDFMRLVDLKFAPLKLDGGGDFDRFPRVRKLRDARNKLGKRLNRELKKSKGSDGAKQLLSVLFKCGEALNKISPNTKDSLDIEHIRGLKLDEHIDSAFELAGNIKSLAGSRWVPRVIKDYFGFNYHQKMVSDFSDLAGDEYVGDLSAALKGEATKKWTSLTHAKIKERDSLLLVLDDFEILGKTVANFVVTKLIPKLEQAKLKTLLLVVGRDDMQDAHVGFQHHHSGKIKENVRLEKLPLATAEQMFKEAGYSDEEAAEMTQKTQGYPFLVATLCETKNRNVMFYQRFVERTTRWMSYREKEWVIPLAYLNRVDLETIQRVLPDENPSVIMSWFQKEASLRDPKADHYVIAPFIREMLLEHNKRIVGETEHNRKLDEANS